MLRTLALCVVLFVAMLALAEGAVAQILVDDPVADQYRGEGASAETASAQASQDPGGLEAQIGGLPSRGLI